MYVLNYGNICEFLRNSAFQLLEKVYASINANGTLFTKSSVDIVFTAHLEDGKAFLREQLSCL